MIVALSVTQGTLAGIALHRRRVCRAAMPAPVPRRREQSGLALAPVPRRREQQWPLRLGRARGPPAAFIEAIVVVVVVEAIP